MVTTVRDFIRATALVLWCNVLVLKVEFMLELQASSVQMDVKVPILLDIQELIFISIG
ncbi:hypothetical protein BDFB_012520 [Asbolus verrucosus]|uniref:Uncharacterized protein n=1 Tax=Asbolus verrucosus TaxID=1661398 RepID=A0A482VBA8_ASBVE|nr:hypothetical protein BDFB_012520 [Asbolus verrucosus]